MTRVVEMDPVLRRLSVVISSGSGIARYLAMVEECHQHGSERNALKVQWKESDFSCVPYISAFNKPMTSDVPCDLAVWGIVMASSEWPMLEILRKGKGPSI
jgi:hypothetical protein